MLMLDFIGFVGILAANDFVKTQNPAGGAWPEIVSPQLP